MECQVEKNKHFRHLLLYEFNWGSKAAEAAKNNCAIYLEDSVAEIKAEKWFARFKQGNFYTSDTLRSGGHLVGYVTDYPLWTAWEKTDRHYWTLLSIT
jgi:hypothetical protein